MQNVKQALGASSHVSVIALVLLALTCASPDKHASENPPALAARPETMRLQVIVERLQEDHHIPGLAVAIAEGSNEPVIAVAGFADLEHCLPVTTDTPFFLGSVSKNLFATVVLRLVDQGRLDLQAPLSEYVQWPRGEEITIRMLLNHTSGIPEYLTSSLFQETGDGGIPNFFRRCRTPEELLASLPDRSPIFEPGSRQGYSNTNGLLVGEVIRQITGQPLATVLDQQIVQNLNLQQMYLFGTSGARRERARGYSGAGYWGAAEGELADCSAADEALPDSADGSVVASAGDLLRYHQALRQGKLLSGESWNAMSTVQPGFHNGLGYLLAEGPFGGVQGNLGKSMGNIAANLYYADLDAYVVVLSNRSDIPLPLEPLLRQWFQIEDQ